MLAQVWIELEHARATLRFHGASPHHQHDTTTVTGTQGALISAGEDLQHQNVYLRTEAGLARPELTGDWFTTGFHGTMAELMSSLEDSREPDNSARRNLPSLALAFAACSSVASGMPCKVGRTTQG